MFGDKSECFEQYEAPELLLLYEEGEVDGECILKLFKFLGMENEVNEIDRKRLQRDIINCEKQLENLKKKLVNMAI